MDPAHDDEDTFTHSTLPIEDFILFNYYLHNPGYSPDLVGVDSARRKLKIYHNIEGNFKENKEIDYISDSPIHMVIPGDFERNGKPSYLVIKNVDNKYTMTLVFDDNEFLEIKQKSRILPTVVMTGKNFDPKIVIQTGEEGLQYLHLKDQKIESEYFSFPYKIHKIHSMSCLGYDEGLNVEMLMVVTVGEKNVLITKEGRKIMELPEILGPIIFRDMDGDGKLDMIYISQEENNYYLNIRPITSTQKNQSTVFNLSDYFNRELEPIIEISELDGLAGGIHTADIKCNGEIDIILVMKQGEKKIVRVFETRVIDNKLIVREPKYANPIQQMEYVVSASTYDLNRPNRENLLINYAEGGTFRLAYFQNSFYANHFHLTFTGIEAKRGSTIPGMTYRIKTMSENLERVCVQAPQTSFLTLYKPYAFLGLGTMNILIDEIFITVPGKMLRLANKEKIIPNSNLILKIGKSVDIELVLDIKSSLWNAIYVTLAVMLLNLIIVGMLTLRDRRRRLRAKRMSEEFNFGTL